MKKLIETKSFEDFMSISSPYNVEIKIKQSPEWKVCFYEENGPKCIYLENIFEIEDERLNEKLTLDAGKILKDYQELMDHKINAFSTSGVGYPHTGGIFILEKLIRHRLKKNRSVKYWRIVMLR